ncbi:VOC family protein [Vibrio sp. ER1A]|uniref:VOC family protein n=1 Tax=Vibrio sp. ER1A TaxID=1517681 RepID=UPI0004DD6060|nr:VOC family protein [Vibrio sp. ER1A]KFA99855.1 GloA glyoxalase/bleomycin resistance protein [Vibrio sp. ER1A]
MIVKGFDHFTIRTDKIEETKNFYMNLLGLTVGARPNFSFHGYWLYLDDIPIFHLVEPALDEEDEVAKYLGLRNNNDYAGSGKIDHLAFRIEGYSSLLNRIRKNSWHHFERTVPEIYEHQVFVSDPNEITVELIFHDSEYQQ